MADTYLRSKFLSRLSQHQKLLRTRINPEKYWGFIQHLKDYFKIKGLDVELRQINLGFSNTIFKINLEIYFEKQPKMTFNVLTKIFQMYFYEHHDVILGQDYMFITLNDDNQLLQTINEPHFTNKPNPSLLITPSSVNNHSLK